jgi:phenylalanyl-tRNA synthetase alpha chain
MEMTTETMTAGAIRAALTLRDLTDPASGTHAMQLLLEEIEQTLASRWRIPVRRERSHPVVSVHDNYERLLVPPEAVTRDARYTRYLNDQAILRTHTSTIVPPVLDRLSIDPPVDLLLSCPGLCYRRDSIDRRHSGEPHQLDLWRVRCREPALGGADLIEMVDAVVDGALPRCEWRVCPTRHPYTEGGMQIDARTGDEWLEIGECGMASSSVLTGSDLAVPPASGLAMGLGLDRLLMLRKGIDDIRLLRATDPRIARQMMDLEPYRTVSSMPPVRRDLSIATAMDATEEELGDRIRWALGPDARTVETLEVVHEAPYGSLPEAAQARLGIQPDQKNVLVRVVLRDLERTLTDAEANELRDRIYAAIHEGTAWTWAAKG